jgi:hypothetical protein
MTTDTDAVTLATIATKLDGLMAEVSALRAERMTLTAGPVLPRTAYSVKETAALLGRDEYTVREWCRLGQVNAHKGGRCGKHVLWRIATDEIQRYREEGLLPIEPERNAGGHRRGA